MSVHFPFCKTKDAFALKHLPHQLFLLPSHFCAILESWSLFLPSIGVILVLTVSLHSTILGCNPELKNTSVCTVSYRGLSKTQDPS